MKRRTLLQFLAASWVTAFSRLRLLAQSPATLTDGHIETLEALAEAGLPSTLGDAGRAAVVRDFVAWHRNYREGADRGHGYGSSRLRPPSGPPPARQYPAQFAALDAAAVAAGAASFATMAIEGRRAIIERRLNEPEPTNRLPRTPTGENLVADCLGFYFNSPDAWDLCYQAEIGSDRCRGLEGSDQPPAPLGGR
jgi:hypothetical protein